MSERRDLEADKVRLLCRPSCGERSIGLHAIDRALAAEALLRRWLTVEQTAWTQGLHDETAAILGLPEQWLPSASNQEAMRPFEQAEEGDF